MIRILSFDSVVSLQRRNWKCSPKGITSCLSCLLVFLPPLYGNFSTCSLSTFPFLFFLFPILLHSLSAPFPSSLPTNEQESSFPYWIYISRFLLPKIKVNSLNAQCLPFHNINWMITNSFFHMQTFQFLC